MEDVTWMSGPIEADALGKNAKMAVKRCCSFIQQQRIDMIKERSSFGAM